MNEIDPRQYDRIAAEYARGNMNSPCNAHYERPAMLAYLGNVRGLRIFEAGCGPGFLLHALQERGALVAGVDASIELLSIAREAMPDAKLVEADLGRGVPFARSGWCDLVVGSLILHYLEDPTSFLEDCFSILRPGGRIVMSTHHPFADIAQFQLGNYFQAQLLRDVWIIDDSVSFDVEFFHRSLTDVLLGFTEAGFNLESVWEPQPDSECWAVDPVRARELAAQPRHLFIAGVKSQQR